MNSSCKYSNKSANRPQDDQTEESAEYSIHNESRQIASNISQDNGLSIFKNNEGEKSIKYISWENVIKFINYETFALSTFDRMTEEEALYIGTYTLEITNNVTFLNVHFDDGKDERWLILANGTICDIYKSDGKHIYGVTGSVNRDEIIWPWRSDSISASSYLQEGNISYSPSNLSDYYNDIPWAEGIDGYGINEKIFLRKRTTRNGVMHISIGYVSYDKPYLYEYNSRPKKIKLSVENKFSIIVDLKDTPHYQEIKLPNDMDLDDILILEILDVYQGTKYEDTCINTIFLEENSGFYEDNNYWDN